MADTIDEVFLGLDKHFKPGVVDKELSFYFSVDDHKWTVTVRPEDCTIERGKTVENADCFVKTNEELFLRMYNGHHYPGMSDFLTGKIKSNNPYMMKTFVEAFSG